MAVAQPTPQNTKLRLTEAPVSLIEGNKFLKWSGESSLNLDKNNNATGVTLRMDEKCFILYWRDAGDNKNEYLDLSSIRDIKTGKYANIPKDKHLKEILCSGKSAAPIQDKTISVYYGPDFINIQIVNFVCVADNADEVAKQWTEFILKCITNPRVQNLSPWESLMKLRTVLLYGKAVIDEKTRNYKLPVQTLIDTFVTNGKQSVDSERQHVIHMLQSVGIPCSKNDMLDEQTLTQEKFFQLFLRLVSKEDIEQIFTIYATKRKLFLLPEQFENFLNREQRDPSLNELLYPFHTVEKSAEMILKFETDESFRKKKQLSPQGLIRYLMDFENETVDPIKYELNNDMDQPLSHYFVNSSHNTYLTGHQITGRSDAEMYRQVLISGCRCVELDCHDDDSDEPIITHGKTLCTKILFSEAIRAINEAAFKTSPYPVILSFENFCGKKMQEKMAKYMIDIFGDHLLREPLNDFPLIPGLPLPSPEQLKYKILIKFRSKLSQKNSQHLQSNFKSDLPLGTGEGMHQVRLTSITQSILEYDSSLSQHPSSCSNSLINTSGVSSSTSNHNGFMNKPSINKNPLTRNNSQQTISDSDSDKEDNIGETALRNEMKTSTPVVRSLYKPRNSNGLDSPVLPYLRESQSFNQYDLSKLVNYFQPTTFRSFEVSHKKNRSFEISSFVETTAFTLHKEKPTEFVNYNKRQFSRIYPKGTRISSENYIPQIFWNVGCQMVALNFQTLDLAMQLNMGKFEYNNKCGYLLKPEILRRTDVNKLFDPFSESPLDGIVASTLKIRIISGVFFNVSRNENEKRLGHTVTVELYGLPADSIRGPKAYRVKAASTTTFNVVYSDPFGSTFKKIIMPQLALLKITVYDDQSKQISHRVLPVVGLRPGYRYICLKNDSNQQLLMNTLFVHIQSHDYVPEEYEEFANALVNPISYVKSLSKKEEMLKTLTDDTENYYDDTDLNDIPDNFNQNAYPNDDINSDTSKSSNNSSNSAFVSQLEYHSNLRKTSTNLELKLSNRHSGNASNTNNYKRHSIIGPVSIRAFKSINNLTAKLSEESNAASASTTPYAIITPTYSINHFIKLPPPLPTHREKSFSLSVEKFNQSLLWPKSSLRNIFDKTKNKSQTELCQQNKSESNLSSSMYNMPRSCSLNCYELDFIDLKKLYISNTTSQLNDPTLFLEINLEELKSNKSYATMVKEFSKKLEKLEKETEKKISELNQNLTGQLEKIKQNSDKLKSKLEKNCFKQTKKILNINIDMKQSKSVNNLDAVFKAKSNSESTESNNINHGVFYYNSKLNETENLENKLKSANEEFTVILLTTKEKHVKNMIQAYAELFKNMKTIKLMSIQSLGNKLEKLINEINENRMQQLKLISEKETQALNKQIHELIKLKKKKASNIAQDKNEFLRHSREIEKDSVAFAVCENNKIEELLIAKQKLVKNIIEKSLKELKTYKEKLLNEYEYEYSMKLREKVDEIQSLYDCNVTTNTQTTLTGCKVYEKSQQDFFDLKTSVKSVSSCQLNYDPANKWNESLIAVARPEIIQVSATEITENLESTHL